MHLSIYSQLGRPGHLKEYMGTDTIFPGRVRLKLGPFPWLVRRYSVCFGEPGTKIHTDGIHSVSGGQCGEVEGSTHSWHSDQDMARAWCHTVLFVSSMRDKNAFLYSQHTTTSWRFCELSSSLPLLAVVRSSADC